MAYSGILKITDGTNSVSFLAQSAGVILQDWKPNTGQAKGGAIWSSSQFSDGRQMVMRSWDNIVETFDTNLVGADMDGSIAQFRKLLNLLTLAGAYWMSDYQVGTGAFVKPIWIEARADCETNTRYAYIYDGTIPALSNPHEFPYRGGTTETIPVIIEHGVWRDHAPGSSECMKTYSYVERDGSITELSEPTQNEDVIWVETISSSLQGLGDPWVLGEEPNPGFAYKYESAIRFRDVDVPQGSTILGAYVISFGDIDEGVGVDLDVDIYAESNMTPAVFSTYANYAARVMTAATIPWTMGEIFAGQQWVTPDISTIIQEIISNAGWVSGNDIAIFFKNPDSAVISAKQMAGYNNATYDPPVLYIAYEASGVQYGVYLPVCSNNYAVGYDVQSQPDWVSHYDASTLAYSGNLNPGPFPFNLFPTPLGVGDRLYIGSDYPFANIDFNLVSAGNGTVTYTYKYSTTVGIASGALSNVVEYPFALFSGLGNTGFKASILSRPSSWAKNTLGPLPNKYWVVLEITNIAVAPGTLPAQTTKAVYSTSWPFWEVTADEVKGDIAALLKFLLVQIETLGGAGAAKGAYNHILFGLRHHDRGADYTPYLNVQANPPGITFLSTAAATEPDNSLAPSGKSLNYTTALAVAETVLGTWSFSGANIVQQYYGRYRVFVRARVTVGAANSVGFRVTIRETTPTFTELASTDVVYNSNTVIPGYDLIDLGYVIVQSPGGLVYTSFQIDISAITTIAATVDVLDMILFPVDEGTLEYQTNSDGVFDYDSTAGVGYQPLHDSTIPKIGPYSGVIGPNANVSSPVGNLLYTMQTKSLGLFTIPNKARMRLYFLPWNDTDGALKGTESMFDGWFHRVQQYLNMRGDE